jgi:excisionase family DNA binding protein
MQSGIKKEDCAKAQRSIAMTTQKLPFNYYDRWLRTSDVASYLGTSVGNIRQMVYRGTLKAKKFNGRLMFKKSEIDLLIEFSKEI